MTIRTLVLSGGGGRGAFHAGVYKYLSQSSKNGVDPRHSGAWMPDVIVGTSIGAVNGAAVAQGITAEALEQFWLSLREEHVQGLPPNMGPLARGAFNWVLKRYIGSRLPQVAPDKAFSPPAEESWPPIPILPRWLAERLIGRWSNLLDTAPLHETLVTRLGLDEAKIAASSRKLLIYATNVRTGEGVIFANCAVLHPQTGLQRSYVRSGVTLRRIIASCSIPLVYPWTQDYDGELYWDGALVANTPLGAAFDAVADRSLDEPMEIVVVLLNPWWDEGDAATPAPRYPTLPNDFGEAAAWVLDWTMLASFRVSLRMMRAFNRMIEQQKTMGVPPTYRQVREVIVAPDEFLPVWRIIDYDEPASRHLIAAGYTAAEKAFKRAFPPRPVKGGR